VNCGDDSVERGEGEPECSLALETTREEACITTGVILLERTKDGMNLVDARSDPRGSLFKKELLSPGLFSPPMEGSDTALVSNSIYPTTMNKTSGFTRKFMTAQKERYLAFTVFRINTNFCMKNKLYGWGTIGDKPKQCGGSAKTSSQKDNQKNRGQDYELHEGIVMVSYLLTHCANKLPNKEFHRYSITEHVKIVSNLTNENRQTYTLVFP
jgi:hypothetical protein